MSDDNQILIPPSFFAVYTDARQRLREPIGVVRARYEICEDLASHLVGHAQIQHHTEVPVENEILARIHAGLPTILWPMILITTVSWRSSPIRHFVTFRAVKRFYIWRGSA